MATPFERLKQTINKVNIEYNINNYALNPQPDQGQAQYDTPESGCCCSQNVVSSCTCHNTTVQGGTVLEYFQEKDVRRVIQLLEQQKNSHSTTRQMLAKAERQLRSLQQNQSAAINKLSTNNTRLTSELEDGRRHLERYATQAKRAAEKEKVLRQEIDRVNEMLVDLNLEINKLRSRNQELENANRQLQMGMGAQKSTSDRAQEDYLKQIKSLENEVEERKKIIDYTILGKTKQINQLKEEADRRVRGKESKIQQLERELRNSEVLIQKEKEKQAGLSDVIKAYQATINSKNLEESRRTEEFKRLRESLEERISILTKDVEKYRPYEDQVLRLTRELEDEKANEKYHIVQIKDKSLEIEAEMLRRQVKDLITEKAIFEQRLKRACRCKSFPAHTSSTLQEGEGLGKLQGYIKSHEIRLVRPDN